MQWFRSRPKSAPENRAERQAYTHMLAKFSDHVLHTDSQLFPPKEGPYQDRPPLCPFRLLPLLIYSGSTIAFLKFQGPKSKNIENVILLQP